MEKPDYIYIRAWHQMTGSYQYYVDMMVARARRDNAPENAIYYNDYSQKWETVDDIASPEARTPPRWAKAVTRTVLSCNGGREEGWKRPMPAFLPRNA